MSSDSQKCASGTFSTVTSVKMSSHILVVLDTNPAAWALQAQYGLQGLKYDTATSSIVAFLRAFSALHPSNKFSFLAAHTDASFYIYPPEQIPNTTNNSSTSTPTTSAPTTDSTSVLSRSHKRGRAADSPMPLILEHLQRLSQDIHKLHDEEDDEEEEDEEVECVSLASALSRAMGRANLLRRRSADLDLRVLVVMASQDYSSYYVPLMNTIFCAEHLGVRMDCLNVCGERSKFMEQAVYQTNGVYQHLDGDRGKERGGILQHLLTHFLIPSDRASKPSMQHVLGRSTSVSDVDLRATCLESGESISTGVVCSVCLSIFSQPMFREMNKKGKCATCGTPWKIAKRSKKKR